MDKIITSPIQRSKDKVKAHSDKRISFNFDYKTKSQVKRQREEAKDRYYQEQQEYLQQIKENLNNDHSTDTGTRRSLCTE